MVIFFFLNVKGELGHTFGKIHCTVFKKINTLSYLCVILCGKGAKSFCRKGSIQVSLCELRKLTWVYSSLLMSDLLHVSESMYSFIHLVVVLQRGFYGPIIMFSLND